MDASARIGGPDPMTHGIRGSPVTDSMNASPAVAVTIRARSRHDPRPQPRPALSFLFHAPQYFSRDFVVCLRH